MAHWRCRIYTCKNKKCKKSVEVTPEDDLVCDSCETPLVGSIERKSPYLGFNPMARTTKMEFSDQTHKQTMKEFRTQRK